MFGTKVLNVLVLMYKRECQKVINPSPVLYANHEGINEGRVVLHSDLNNFFASVECKRRPELAGFPVAVCGSKKDRHGIVLAKNQLAKQCGIATGQAIWQAKQKCKDLFVIEPDYEEYVKFSRAAKKIYLDYSDRVESFGMDEAWIELTGDRRVKTLSDGVKKADEIRRRIKKELGITVSVGVSDNKVFAKLASDYKKPDAVTLFGPDNYFDVVSKIDIGEMLFVGKNTKKRLNQSGIATIGGAAQANMLFIKSMFGEVGVRIYCDACGFNMDKVEKNGERAEIKSVGNSVTLAHDLKDYQDVKEVFHALSEKVAYRLRKNGFLGTTVQISVRDTSLSTVERRCSSSPTNNALELAKCAEKLYRENFDVNIPVRSVGIRMTNLVKSGYVQNQWDMLDTSFEKSERRAIIDRTLDEVRKRYGVGCVKRAVNCVGKEYRIGERFEIT